MTNCAGIALISWADACDISRLATSRNDGISRRYALNNEYHLYCEIGRSAAAAIDVERNGVVRNNNKWLPAVATKIVSGAVTGLIHIVFGT